MQSRLLIITGAIELNPRDRNIYNNRGIAKISMKDIDGAIADYNKALEINPKFTNSYINRSNALLMKKDIRGAIKDLNQAIIIRPHYANAYLLRGLARFELNDYASALRDFDQCIKLDPQNAYAYNNRGIVKQKLEDFKGAINDYNLALQLDPTMANAYLNRGIAKENLKYRDTIRITPLQPSSIQNLHSIQKMLITAHLRSQRKTLASKPRKISKSNNAGTGFCCSKYSSKFVEYGYTAPAGGRAKQNAEPKKETKEERDRRRYKLSLADAGICQQKKRRMLKMAGFRIKTSLSTCNLCLCSLPK